MYNKDNNTGKFGDFPDPFSHYSKKATKPYGLKYAKAIEKQWGNSDDERSLFKRRMKDFETNRDYANGTQDTSIYKQILNSLDPNNGDGTMLNLDWSPVPIIPKFVKIVVNNILSKKPYPNVKASDPLSQSEKERKRAKKMYEVENRALIQELEHKNKSIDDVIESINKDPFGLKENNTSNDRKMKQFLDEHSNDDINKAVVMYMVDSLNYFKNYPTD